MRFATSYIHALTGTCEVGLLERYDTIVYYRPKHRTAPECTVVQHQFGIGMHLVRVQRFSGHGGRLFHSLRPGTENHRPRR